MNLRTQSWIRSVTILFSPCKGALEYRNDARENDPLYTLDKASSFRVSEEALKVGDPHYMVVLTCVDAIHLCMRCTLIERGLMEIVCIMLCSENGLHELRNYGYSNSPNAIPILLFQ